MKTSKIKAFSNKISKFSQTIFVLFAFSTTLPCNAQSLNADEVVATAGLGGNEVKVITLTPRSVNCHRSMEPDKCFRENQGTFKTTYTINCVAESIHYSNEFGSNVENVVPGQISSATSAFYLVYDYACNTDYSER
jgi:hypothetical protein